MSITIFFFVIIMIGKTALFEPQPSLEYSIGLVCSWYNRDHLVLNSDFATAMLLPSNVVSLASKPQPGRPNLSIYVPQ
jgi:hypothetical protein